MTRISFVSFATAMSALRVNRQTSVPHSRQHTSPPDLLCSRYKSIGDRYVLSLCSPGRGRHDNERRRGKCRRQRENLLCRIVTWVLEEEFVTTRASQCEFPRGVCRVGVRVSSSCLVLRAVHASHASLDKYAHAPSRVHAFHVYACGCMCVFTRAKYDIIYPLDCWPVTV